MKKFCLNCKKEFDTCKKSQAYCSELCKRIGMLTAKAKFLSLAKMNSVINSLPVYHVKEGFLFDGIQQVSKTESFLVFCHSMLWSTRDFTEEEKNKLLRLVSQHFECCQDINDTFKDLVEKVVLAKRYVLEKPYRFVAEPQDWLNIKFYNGLSGASKWHEALQEQRKITPHYGESLQVFAEAILNFSEKRNLLDIAFYRQVLIGHKAWDLLQWYMNAVMHFQFINY